MVSLSDIWVRLEEVQRRTLSNPSYILMTEANVRNLIREYEAMIQSDPDMWDGRESPKINVYDLMDFLGMEILFTTRKLFSGFKILEEVRADS